MERAFTLILGIIMAMNSQVYEKVFYCTYQTDECIESSNPVRLEENGLTELLERVGAIEKNFIGFTDEDGITLQFYIDAIDDIWMEIPVQSELGSYGIQINESKMKDIVKNLEAPYFNYKTKFNMSFRAW